MQDMEVMQQDINFDHDSSEGVEDLMEDRPYRKKEARKVQTQPYDYAVRSMMDMVVDGDLLLNPDYQRNYRWDDEKASRFVESLLLNIPVPVIYLSEEPDTTFTVIDGQQRLSSLLRFIRPEEVETVFKDDIEIEPLILKNLRVRSDLNDKSFKELSREDKSALQKRHMRCIVILNESDLALKFEVFERLNTGSVKLTDQEIRNCIHRGNFNSLINDLSKNHKFQELISLPKKHQKDMKSAELVLRFFAYRELPPDYNENYTEFLNEYMDENRVIGASKRDSLNNLFENSINCLYDILGPGIAFRKPWNRQNPMEGRWTHTSINGAIYESQMIVYSCLPNRQAITSDKMEEIRNKTFEIFADDGYWDAVSQGTATKARVLKRSLKLHDKLKEVIELQPLQLV